MYYDFKKKYSLMLPSNERILKFTKRVEFFTVQEFVGVYGSPIDITLPSELTWPCELPLEYMGEGGDMGEGLQINLDSK